MSEKLNRLYCSQKCKDVELVRSFDICPICNNVWNTKTKELAKKTSKYYRNNSWKMCESCSLSQQACVVCGKSV